jgi:NAD(P)-dependent dehydrogenase (short-subunit alcohol dehydrogenase family)
MKTTEVDLTTPVSAPAQGHGVVADLFRVDEIEAAVKEAIQKMGGLDILVNNGA